MVHKSAKSDVYQHTGLSPMKKNAPYMQNVDNPRKIYQRYSQEGRRKGKKRISSINLVYVVCTYKVTSRSLVIDRRQPAWHCITWQNNLHFWVGIASFIQPAETHPGNQTVAQVLSCIIASTIRMSSLAPALVNSNTSEQTRFRGNRSLSFSQGPLGIMERS
ncbi:hypothetical protein BDN67DRAFT_63336 [Paxillus ammoniavirescens]|nr:hypothetical protein BDN67DRAFT_63336 [Paxillus ammoniavirescens]